MSEFGNTIAFLFVIFVIAASVFFTIAALFDWGRILFLKWENKRHAQNDLELPDRVHDRDHKVVRGFRVIK